MRLWLILIPGLALAQSGNVSGRVDLTNAFAGSWGNSALCLADATSKCNPITSVITADPDSGADACNTGVDFATREEALAAFADPWAHVNAAYYRPEGTAWLEVDGPDLHATRKNPAYRPSRDEDDGEWRRERAMQAGMGLGVQAYNDEMGY